MKDLKHIAIKSVLEKTRSLYDKKICAISLASDNKLSSTVDEVVSTGIVGLDLVCARSGPRKYGLPFGRQIEIFGNESSGKTTLLLQIAANTQRIGGMVYWLETEGGLDLTYAKKLGVNTEEMIVSQPDFAEQVFDEIEVVTQVAEEMNDKIPITVLWDSVAATQTKQEMEGDFGDSHMASFGRFISQSERKINTALSKQKILFVFSNQIRSKIGGYGRPIVTYGEGTLKFYCSIRLQLMNKEQIKEKGSNAVLGNKVGIKILKNKCMDTAFFELEPINLIKGKGFIYGSSLVNALDMKHRIDRSKKGWLGIELEGEFRSYRESDLVNDIETNSKIKNQCLDLLFKKKKLIEKE